MSFVASCVRLLLRPLPSTGVTRLPRYFEPLRHPIRPGLSLASCQLILTAITAGGSRVASGLLCVHAIAITPVGPMELVRSSLSIVSGLPCEKVRSAPAIVVSGPAQRSLSLWPVRSRSRLATLSIESSDSFVASTAVSIATGWSEPVPGRELHPLKSSAFSRRTVSPIDLPPPQDGFANPPVLSDSVYVDLPRICPVGRQEGAVSPVVNQSVGQDALVGQTLGHYCIVEKIGAGGMGEVFRAHDQHLDPDVAIKFRPPGTRGDESAHKRFHKEALALSKLNHPNIATIPDFDTQRGVDFLVMEYIPGIMLSEKLAARLLPEKEVISLGTQLAEGLSAAHERGVVHRDLKPGNLRLTADGRLKILDFGLARLRLPVTPTATTERLSETQTMAATLPYMAPEQLLGGEIEARTAIHTAGEVLYEMATGQQPFAQMERSQLIGAILHRPPRPATALNPRLSPELERIISKCLEKEPENRYQSAKELAIDLRRFALPAGSRALASSPASKRRSWLVPACFGLTLLALLLVSFAFNLGGIRKRMFGHGNTVIQSIAVLPLENLSHDQQQEYFVDGMTDELITDLARIKGLRVISRTSAMHYKGTRKTLPEIAAELHVDAIVEGSVLREGDRLRVTAQLIHAATDTHLWAESYQRDVRDFWAVQNDVARAIANAIEIKLTPKEQGHAARTDSATFAVHDAYLKGRYH